MKVNVRNVGSEQPSLELVEVKDHQKPGESNYPYTGEKTDLYSFINR